MSKPMQKHHLCAVRDLIPDAGVPALIAMDGVDTPIALFYVDGHVYAISNIDPGSGASVMSRGIVGSLGEDLVVASPLYKEHYRLQDGTCVEKDWQLAVYEAGIDDDRVWIKT